MAKTRSKGKITKNVSTSNKIFKQAKNKPSRTKGRITRLSVRLVNSSEDKFVNSPSTRRNTSPVLGSSDESITAEVANKTAVSVPAVASQRKENTSIPCTVVVENLGIKPIITSKPSKGKRKPASAVQTQGNNFKEESECPLTRKKRKCDNEVNNTSIKTMDSVESVKIMRNLSEDNRKPKYDNSTPGLGCSTSRALSPIPSTSRDVLACSRNSKRLKKSLPTYNSQDDATGSSMAPGIPLLRVAHFKGLDAVNNVTANNLNIVSLPDTSHLNNFNSNPNSSSILLGVSQIGIAPRSTENLNNQINKSNSITPIQTASPNNGRDVERNNSTNPANQISPSNDDSDSEDPHVPAETTIQDILDAVENYFNNNLDSLLLCIMMARSNAIKYNASVSEKKRKSRLKKNSYANTLPVIDTIDLVEESKPDITPKEEVKLREGLGNCPICMDIMTNKPVASTVCGHIFCMVCIQSAIKSIGRKCPKCRKTFDLEGPWYHQLFP